MRENRDLGGATTGSGWAAVDRPKLRPDWAGWIALAWVLWWGWAYGLMAVQARAPQVLAWIRSVTSGH